VIAAAQAGKHVLCDKPLALTVPDARRCVEECRAAGVRLGLTFQTRRHDGLAEAADLVRSGAIGRVVVAEVQMSGGRNLAGGWRTDPALAGLGHHQHHRRTRSCDPGLVFIILSNTFFTLKLSVS
jgi:predicted dehydrogenase